MVIAKKGDIVRTPLGEKAVIIAISDSSVSPKIEYEILEYATGRPGLGSRFVSDGSNLTPWELPTDHIRPKHYGGPDDPYEPLKVMLAQHGKDAVVNFCWLTAEKYLARAGKKSGEPIARDFRKAAFYLTHAAELLEKP